MPTHKDAMTEYADISLALCDWFHSQDIPLGKAVAVMGYLIGVLAADATNTKSEALEKIELVTLASKAIALGAFDYKR